MSHWIRRALGSVVLAISALGVFAGGSGLNVVVVVNTNSSNSLQLGNYYCEQRGVPPQNVLRIGWAGGNVNWTLADFESRLRTPLDAMLASRQLTNQVDFVLLSMDIPYRVTNSTGTVNNNVNATTAALFYGFKNNPANPMQFCSLPASSASAYAGSEGIFRQTPPIGPASNSWLVMMLTSSNLAQAKAVVDRGVASDYSFPTQRVYLAESDDRLRNVRLHLNDDALLEVRLRGQPPILRTNVNSPNSLGLATGYQNGIQTANLSASAFVPGAMADQLTSFGGWLFENSGHTDALDFLNAGATASYGTIIEPCAYFAKFPSPRAFYYQARGFSIAESYYLSVTNPYQGILIGEPLAAPFAVPAVGDWIVPAADAVLSGTTNLAVSFQSPDASRPIQQVDLFVDGILVRALTNIAPQPGNVLYVTLNGFETNYTVPNNATIQSVVSNLASRLNAGTFTNLTRITAIPRGDRIELRSFDIARSGEDTSLGTSNHVGNAITLSTLSHAARNSFLDRMARGSRGYLITNAQVTLAAGEYLQCIVLKTNGSVVTVATTNETPGAALNQFAKTFFAAINTNLDLTAADGLAVENLNMHEDEPFRTFVYGPNDHSGEFSVRARSPGWPESQMQVAFSGSSAFDILDAGTNRLDENINDLYPRNHLYVTAGVTNLALTFGFDTTTQADGLHKLTAVAYEGSHVRTQKRVSRNVRIQNSSLSAVFNCLLCDTNSALEAMLQFSVEANTTTIASIELFSTGGSWGVASNQPTAMFSLAATHLGAGRHPFSAVVTRDDGQQYRTETKWIRINSNDTPFALTVTGSAPEITWPATAGRRYEVLSATNVADAFVLRDSVVPTNSPGRWTETNHTAPQRFYRVRSVP